LGVYFLQQFVQLLLKVVYVLQHMVNLLLHVANLLLVRPVGLHLLLTEGFIADSSSTGNE
jgi:hypothetical protein